MLVWPLLAVSLFFPREERHQPVSPHLHHCQYSEGGSNLQDTPSIFKESQCLGDVTLPTKKPSPMPVGEGYCPDCPAVAGRVPLNPANFGKPYLGTSSSPAGFQGITGTPTKIKNAYNGKGNGWAPIEGQGSYWNTIAAADANPNLMYLMSYSLIPTSEGRAPENLPKCANGEYNDHYKAFALSMKNRHISSMLIRPGWELTLKSWPWGTNNDVNLSHAYAGCFRNFVATVQANYPENHFIYEWNVHQAATLSAMQAAWPGANFVDVVGTDIYDAYYGPASCASNPACRWTGRTQNVLNLIGGFAKTNGKAMAITEWGVWTNKNGDNRGAGDNAYFIQKFCEWIKDESNHVLYYVYFDEDSDGDSRLGIHPRSVDAFRQYCVGNPGNPHDDLR